MPSKTESMSKSAIWRILGVLVLWIISLTYTGSIPQATAITFIHHAIFLVIYWIHERIWLRARVGVPRAVIKAFTYEIVIAIPVLTMISWIFTGDPWRALAISINYTIFKLFLYVIYEKIWERIFSRKIIYLDMVGDLFHVGHLNAIKAAARRGSVVVGLVNDSHVAKYKRKPVIPWGQRATILLHIKGVEKVMSQENLTSAVVKNMKSCGATHFLHGDDWVFGKQRVRRVWLEHQGIDIIEIPYTKGISTTRIIRKIRRRV